METLENPTHHSEQDSDNERLLGYEMEEGQTRLSYIKELRQHILGMDQQELDNFENEFLAKVRGAKGNKNTNSKEINLMELDALDGAVSEKKAILTGQDKKSKKETAIDAMPEGELLEKAGHIFEKVKLVEGVDPVPFAREFLKHEKEIEADRDKTEKLFKDIVKEITGSTLKKATLDALRKVIDEHALGENPSAVLKLVKNLLQESNVDFDLLPRVKQQQLRNVVVGTSTFAVDFKAKKPAVDALKKTEEGGYLNIEGEYIGKGGAKNPYIDLSEGDRIHLQENFAAITDLSLKKITGYINEPLPEDATEKDIAEKENRIKKGIKSICNQLGQERWWWARHLEQSQIEKYKSGLNELDSQLVEKIKDQMIADDLKVRVPAHRAIYNELFGGYNEVFEEALKNLDQLSVNKAA